MERPNDLPEEDLDPTPSPPDPPEGVEPDEPGRAGDETVEGMSADSFPASDPPAF